MLDKIKNVLGFKKTKPVVEEKPKRKTRKSEKELATERGEPYVAILSMDVDPENIHNGAFELDWNDKFIANLVRAGYQWKPGEEDHILVDRWFQEVCRNVVLETFEQQDAIERSMDVRYTKSRDIGDGRTEVS